MPCHIACRARTVLTRCSVTSAYLALVIGLAACGNPPPASWVDDARLANADTDQENWLTYGRTYKEQRHSPLAQINIETLDRLGLAWYADMATIRGLEATPLVVDGVIYLTSSWSIMHAFDAATGEHKWTYDPLVNRGHARYVCCDVVNRGPAFYQGKVYAGTLDGRLVAVTAETGDLAWETQTTPKGSSACAATSPRTTP